MIGAQMSRQSLVINALVEFADNLVENFDVIDVLTALSERCTEVLDVDAAGVMLKSVTGEPQIVAASSNEMRVLEVFQLQANEGPCVDCMRDSTAIVNQELDQSYVRWPLVTPKAIALGFHSVHCLPMRLRGESIGALNLFRSASGHLSTEDVAVAQGLADVATIAILQHRIALDAQRLAEQLGHALNSRVIIEQAKGKVAQANGCSMDQAFEQLRSHARNNNLKLTDVALAIVESHQVSDVLRPPPRRRANEAV